MAHTASLLQAEDALMDFTELYGLDRLVGDEEALGGPVTSVSSSTCSPTCTCQRTRFLIFEWDYLMYQC